MRYHHLLILASSFFFSSHLQGGTTMKNTDLELMPYPKQVLPGEGTFRLRGDFTIAVKGQANPRLYHAASRALRRLSGRTGLFFPQDMITRKSSADTGDLMITCMRPGRVVLYEDESYRLRIKPDRIELDCTTDIGGLYGLETLLQLLQADGDGYYFPEIVIEDQPRFPWRGLLIDVCRHWLPMEVMERNLDAMAAVKLNVLHWHLSENQGFRVESKLFPKLHELGSDGLYYTQEQIKAVIAYADDRGIRVMPEFDMPGHTTAWFVGYPELAAGPGPFTIEREYGVKDPVMDPSKESTYQFLDAFWREMTALFPEEYVHIGGDENNGKMWDANADIQAFKKAQGLADNHALQAYFNKRVLEMLTRYQKKLVGWDEILHPDMPTNSVIQSWRGTQALIEAAQKGYTSFLSNGYYIDLCQPASYHYLNDPIPAGSPLNDEERKRILGGEATMWSEIVTAETVDSRIWPRTIAIAERLWSPADLRDIDSMYRRQQRISLQLEELGVQHLKNYEMMLRRLAGQEDVSVLRSLVDLLEPVQEYHRHDHTVYTSYSPFTRVVDAARPESMPAREFDKRVEDYIAHPQSSTRKLLSEQMAQWQNQHPRLVQLARKAPVLAEILPLSSFLARLSQAGQEALVYHAKRQKPKSNWLEEKKELIAAAKKPCAEVELAVVQSIEKLILAMAK